LKLQINKIGGSMDYREAVEFVSTVTHDEWDYDEEELNPEYQDFIADELWEECAPYENSMEKSPEELWAELHPEVPAKRIQPRTIAWAVIALLYVLWWAIIVWYM